MAALFKSQLGDVLLRGSVFPRYAKRASLLPEVTLIGKRAP
jgi:hypothetical protein